MHSIGWYIYCDGCKLNQNSQEVYVCSKTSKNKNARNRETIRDSCEYHNHFNGIKFVGRMEKWAK